MCYCQGGDFGKHFQNLAKSDLNYILGMILEGSILKAFCTYFFGISNGLIMVFVYFM